MSWENLAFQPYFSMTGTNVGYGFWSHDIEGPYNSYEMYTRWVQWAAFSGVFRSHDRGMSAGGCADTNPPSCSIVQVWEVPTPYFEANLAAMQYRASLIPYIYTAWRQAFDTGLSLIRPMYYDYPLLDGAYWANPNGSFPQYMFGDDILASPVVSESDPSNNMTSQNIWIPPGQWYEVTSGNMLTGASDGSTVLTKLYDISEIPVFYKAGSIIPQIPIPLGQTIGLAQQQYNTLIFSIVPGATSGSTIVYEDDGLTMDYLSGQSVFTTAQYNISGNTMAFNVSSNGSYPSFPSTRTVVVRILNSFPPTEVVAGGQTISYARFGGANTWTYSGEEMATIIEITGVSTGSAFTIVVTSDQELASTTTGIKGGIAHATLAKANLDIDRSTPGSDSVSGGALDIAASTGEEISFLAGTNLTAFAAVIASYPVAYAAAIAEITNASIPSLIQLWDAGRTDHCLCGTSGCYNSNSYYQTMWVEGYQPYEGTPGAINLYDYWNSNINDNWATSNATTPEGYVSAAFSNGFVLADAASGTAPLQLWYSETYEDYMTVASPRGISYVQANNYTLISSVLGYVLTSPPPIPAQIVPPERASYSLALLTSGLT